MTSSDGGEAAGRVLTAATRRAEAIPAFVNTAAGNASEVDRALRAAGCFDVREVAPDEVMQSVQAAIEQGASRVVVAGGDGTVSAAAAAVAGTSVELAIIPAGTFNHFRSEER